MERKLTVKKKRAKSVWLLSVFTGIAALFLFRYFRAGNRRCKNEEGD